MSNKILPTPKTDVVFHSLFRQGNENITKALVSAIINTPISSIDLSQDRHLITNSPNDKLGILDLKAILNDNTICNIELQLINNKDTIPRLLFYWSNLFYNQIHRGDNYNELNKTISIAILDYNLENINSTHFPHSIWKISNPFTLTILTDLFELHIIEIPKALKYLENNPNDVVSQWMLFLSEPNNREVLNIMKSNEEIDEAMKKLEEITSDAELMRIIELRKKAIMDYNSGMSNATKQGIEEGLKKGLKQGIEQGYKQGIEQGIQQGIQQGIEQGIEQANSKTYFEIAKNMLNKNIDISIISDVTGLSKEDIQKLL